MLIPDSEAELTEEPYKEARKTNNRNIKLESQKAQRSATNPALDVADKGIKWPNRKGVRIRDFPLTIDRENSARTNGSLAIIK